MKTPVMYILSGMSFAGKSVLAREIAKAKGLPVIDPDEVCREKGYGLHGEFVSEDIWSEIHKEAERRAGALLQEYKSFVYDTTALNKQQRDHLRSLAKGYGAKPVVIIANITKKEAYKRLKENNKTKLKHLVHIDDFTMCADGFEFPKDDEKYIVYQAGENIQEWISKKL